MSRLALSLVPLALAAAAGRVLSAGLTLALALGWIQLSGVDGKAVESAGGLGSAASVAAFLGMVWDGAMALGLLLVTAALVRRKPLARACAWLWLSAAAVEVAIRGLAVCLSPWIGPAVTTALTGTSVMDDACCCLPFHAAWMVVLAVGLVAGHLVEARALGRGLP